MISDEDIDLILSKGEERTAKLQKQMDERFGKVLGENKQSTNLLDFKIDSTSMQLFEGVDYAEKKKRQEELKKMIEETRIMNEVEAANERRQRAQKVNYDEKAQYRELSEAIRKANRGDPKSSNKTKSLNSICRKYNIPRPKDVPRVYSWMLLDVERLRFFEKIEQERFGELVMLFRKYVRSLSLSLHHQILVISIHSDTTKRQAIKKMFLVLNFPRRCYLLIFTRNSRNFSRVRFSRGVERIF